MNDRTSMPQVLLIESQFVLRRTLVSVALDLRVARLQEATNLEVAAGALAARCFDGLVLDLGSGAAAIELLARLRRGEFASDADIPVIGMTTDARIMVEPTVEAFRLLRLVQKPFKIGELLQAVRGMAPLTA